MRFQRGRLDDAVADFREAIRLDDRQYHAFAGLAQVLQRQKKWDEAVEQFTQAIALKPDWSPLYRGRAAVQQERDDPTPEHRAAALARPGGGDPARDAGQSRAGERPRAAGRPAAAEPSLRGGPGGLRRRA